MGARRDLDLSTLTQAEHDAVQALHNPPNGLIAINGSQMKVAIDAEGAMYGELDGQQCRVWMLSDHASTTDYYPAAVRIRL